MSESIESNLEAINQRVAAACAKAGRSTDDVQLIAVSKKFPADAVRGAYEAGHRVFGESRVQEAIEKVPTLPGDIDWHFIGRLQKNKVRKALPLFSTFHSVDSLSLAQAIDRIAREEGYFPRVFLQTNIADESSKTGFSRAELMEQIDTLLELERLQIVGLMTIPPPRQDPEGTRRDFAAVRELRDEIVAATGVPLPELSMGMSGDFELAIEEGSTCVRVGSAIFGQRAY
ncbi:YggS family pyridoxal phosphate-dependent enzyme [Sulfuriroseicoccus oceanibius]|uniref:Pyridoxal phosphate homeostasis protein n=1 Tax=Sulfuriroseicoccus oceanibius TaxID=2707525 RepID=A0A6B3LBW5_9BACT|nr:YggS family pyridoxal phosphate-dependent enzyme [Sulfuriroseicoccus oceanibius]QQL46144.1 YggS family pyridoxal phosphate-dependent enzyme [Sulfuriroseicoccus oceanibius]